MAAFRSIQKHLTPASPILAALAVSASLSGCHPLPTARPDSSSSTLTADAQRSGAAKPAAATLDSPDPAARREALVKLADPNADPLPADVGRYATDSDRAVRRVAVTAIAARHHPQALEVLRRGLADQDFDVRLAAVAGLGLVGGSEAAAELKRLAGNSSEFVREAACRALVDLNDSEAVAQAAADKSWRVRRLAAAGLARDANARFASLGEKLVSDGNPDVARQAIESVARWPLEQAGPVLLTAMSGMPYTPRKLAAAQLAERWPPAAVFEVDASADRRAKLLADLARQWHAEFPSIGPQSASPRSAAGPPGDPATGSPELDQRALAAVERLHAADVRDRRRAAESLRGEFASQPLPDPALARLSTLMTVEADALVWVSVFDVLAGDVREPAIRLTYAALGHPAPEVRRRACEHLSAHPDARHGRLLLASLDDRSPAVVAAAVKALGRLDSLDDLRPLEGLLTSPDHELRVEVAAALARLGADSGKAALERLAFDPDPKVRRAAAVAMGEAPDPSYLPDLIHLLDDRPEIRRAALTSLPRVAGRDAPRSRSESESSVKTAAAPSADDESQLWKEWFRHRSALKLE